ncbi:MAG: type IV pilin [Thermoplasmata archaeon]|nr:type IV pilin [Thermoplasmata archaeon]
MVELSPRQKSFRRPRWNARRGVSEIVGTILLLGMTVALFGSIFLIVNEFPRAPPEPLGQFDTQLIYSTSNPNKVAFVRVLHLGGPTLYQTQTQIYLLSSKHAGLFPAPYSIQAGIPGAISWQIGQAWILNITTYGVVSPDNITVTVTTADSLVFRSTLPVSGPTLPPEFYNPTTNPATPVSASPFSVQVQIFDYLGVAAGKVLVNFSQLPGASGPTTTGTMLLGAGNGTWWYVIPGTISTLPGIYYLFITANDTAGNSNTIAVPVHVIGSESAGPVQVTVALNSSTAPVYCRAPATCVTQPVTIIATIHNTGSSAGNLTTNFSLVGGGGIGFSQHDSIGTGGTLTLFQSWTPAQIGSVTINVESSNPVIGLGIGSITTTIFPAISLYELNRPAASISGLGDSDESALLANELTAAGVPFNITTIACGTSLPTQAHLSQSDDIIVDFGSNETNYATCGPGLSASASADAVVLGQAAAAGVSIWLDGSSAWGNGTTGTCPTAPTFYTDFGLTRTGSGLGCTNAVTFNGKGAQLNGGAGGQAVYTGDKSNNLRLDGDANSSSAMYWWVNNSIGNSVAKNAHEFGQYQALNPMTPRGQFMNISTTTAANTGVASFFFCPSTGPSPCVDGAREVVTTIEPSQLAVPLYGGQGAEFASGQAGTIFVYNLIDWMTGVASGGASGSANRNSVDAAVDQVTVFNTVHLKTTTFYVGIRSNDAQGGPLILELYVNYQPAEFNGQFVLWSGSLSATYGATDFVPLNWVAPYAGSFNIYAVVTEAGDTDAQNNAATPTLVLNIPLAFT